MNEIHENVLWNQFLFVPLRQIGILLRMTTIDLRMELAQEIQNIPDSEQLLLRVINYVRGITKKENKVITLNGDALRLWKRAEELATLPAGWDGSEAIPIHKKAVQNVQRLIKAGLSSDFKNWVLFPDDNGTLLMQSKDGTSSISIGNNSYSFVSMKEGAVKAGELIKFTPASVLKTMRTVTSA